MYNTVTGLRVKLGLDITSSDNDSLITQLASLADDAILAWTSSPSTYGARVVEGELCFSLYNGGTQLHNYVENKRTMLPYNGLEITPEMKRLLNKGSYVGVVPFDGYNPYDNLLGGH